MPGDREKWLGFYPYDYDSDNDYTDIIEALKAHSADSYYDRIVLRLKQKGALSIRSYTVKDIADADFTQLSDKDGTPVIPGTSWAGAFRSRFKELSGDRRLTDKLFGYVDISENTQQKSKIVFSESRIKDSVKKLITRTSIDRFSGGVKEKALYSEITRYNGECILEISLPSKMDHTFCGHLRS